MPSGYESLVEEAAAGAELDAIAAERDAAQARVAALEAEVARLALAEATLVREGFEEVRRLRARLCARNQDSTSQFCALAEEAALRAADAQNERDHTVGVLQARVAALEAVLAEPADEEMRRLDYVYTEAFEAKNLDCGQDAVCREAGIGAVLADLRQRAGVSSE